MTTASSDRLTQQNHPGCGQSIDIARHLAQPSEAFARLIWGLGSIAAKARASPKLHEDCAADCANAVLD
jgi:hypothetical protein